MRNQEYLSCKIYNPKQPAVLYADLSVIPENIRSIFQHIRVQMDDILDKLNMQFFTGLDDPIKVYTADKMKIFAPCSIDQGVVFDVFNICLQDLQNKNRDNPEHWIHRF